MICPFEGCGKAYSQKNRLKAHIVIHKEGKPYHCNQPECSKTFYEKGNLNTHLRSHLGIKQYKCYFPGCQFKYSLSISLKKHLKTHDSTKENFFCIHCSNSFTRYSTLLVHLKGHETSHAKLLSTKRKLFICTVSKQNKEPTDSLNLAELTKHTHFDSGNEASSSAATETSKRIHKLSIFSGSMFSQEDEPTEENQNDYYNIENNIKSVLSFLQNLVHYKEPDVYCLWYRCSNATK